MSPNQREEDQEQQQQKTTKIGNTNWELDRLSTTGQNFLLEPESRTGIVQELQLRLHQEQQRRLLRSANNALQILPQNVPQQTDEGTPKDRDLPTSTVNQTTQHVTANEDAIANAKSSPILNAGLSSTDRKLTSSWREVVTNTTKATRFDSDLPARAQVVTADDGTTTNLATEVPSRDSDLSARAQVGTADDGATIDIATQASNRDSDLSARAQVGTAIERATTNIATQASSRNSDLSTRAQVGTAIARATTNIATDSDSSTAWSVQPSPSIAPPQQRPIPPCLQCLMRCLRNSGLLNSCWNAAIFELEEAFAIKELADATMGSSGAGAGREPIQPMPKRSIDGSIIFSGGEGLSVPSVQREVSKWQALERLCNLRNSLKTCSHVTGK